MGGGIFVGDFQLGDMKIHALPLPTVCFNFKTAIVTGSFDLIGSPNLAFTFFPEGKFRIIGSLGTVGLRSINDLCGDIAFKYYPFPKQRLLKFLNFMVGGYNNEMSYALKSDEIYEYQFYGVYSGFDLGILTAKAGYNFCGTQMIDSKKVGTLDNGFYLSIQIAYSF